VQILWVNMITVVALGTTLAFEPPEGDIMRRPPRRKDQPVLTGTLLWRIAFVSMLFVAGAFGMFSWAEARGLGIEAARTMVVNAIVVMEVFYLFSVRYSHGSALTAKGLLGTPAVLTGIAIVAVAQALFTYLPAMQLVFHSRPLGLIEGLAVLGVGVALLLVVEAEKVLLRGFRQPRRPDPPPAMKREEVSLRARD
jgi:magnesium-transporting ATPase (P-type)